MKIEVVPGEDKASLNGGNVSPGKGKIKKRRSKYSPGKDKVSHKEGNVSLTGGKHMAKDRWREDKEPLRSKKINGLRQT